MKRFYNSIFFKLSLLFAVSLVLISIISEKNHGIITSELKNYSRTHLLAASQELVAALATGRSLQPVVRQYGLRSLPPGSIPKLIQRDTRKGDFHKAMLLEDSRGLYYLRVEVLDQTYLYADTKQQQVFDHGEQIRQLIYAQVLVLFALFAVLIYLLRPLWELSPLLRRFGEGKKGVRLPKKGSQEFQRIAEGFNNMAQTIEQTMEQKDSYIAFASHELKTPLAKAKLAASFMRGDKSNILRNSLNTMEQVVDNFLLLESRNQGIIKETFTTKELLLEVYPLLSDDSRHVEIHLRADASINADKQKLAVALKNLIHNAIKYSTDTKALVTADSRGITVANRGEPMKQTLQESIEPFKRRDVKGGEGGYGIGLSIAHSVLKAHGMQLRYRYVKGYSYFDIHFF